MLRFDHDMGDLLSHGIDNYAPHLTARATTTADVGTDLDDLVIAAGAFPLSVLGLAIPGFMSVFVGRSLVSDLHSVSSVHTFLFTGIRVESDSSRAVAPCKADGRQLGNPVLTMIDDVSAVRPGVCHDIAEPEGEHEGRDDPQRVEGESD